MYIHISLNVFELDRFLDEMQVVSSENVLFLPREYNDSV